MIQIFCGHILQTDLSLIYGFAENYEGNAGAIQLLQVVHATDTAAGNEFAVGIFAEDVFVQLYGGAVQHPVFADVCAENVVNAFCEITFQKVKQFDAALFFPPVHADEAVSYVGAQDDVVVAVPVEPAVERRGLFDGDAAYGGPVRSVVKDGLNVGVAFDAAAKVYLQGCLLRNLFQNAEIDDMVGLSAVQIDDVKAPETCLLHLQGHFYRAPVNLLRGVVALLQTHALSFDNVNGRDGAKHDGWS